MNLQFFGNALVKAERRILKFAFKRYIAQIKIKRVYDKGDMHAEEYERAIKFKALKRMFRGIKKFYT